MEGESSSQALPLSSSGKEIIEQGISLSSETEQEQDKRPDSADFEQYYEIKETASYILSNGYRNIALQFPDSMISEAVQVVERLKYVIGIENEVNFFILGDTSYGSCCVDEVAAEHIAADLIVHYGRSCLSNTTSTPTLFIFGSIPLDVEHLISQMKSLIVDSEPGELQLPLVVFYDTCYAKNVPDMKATVHTLGLTGSIVITDVPKTTGEIPKENYISSHFNIKLEHTRERNMHFSILGRTFLIGNKTENNCELCENINTSDDTIEKENKDEYKKEEEEKEKKEKREFSVITIGEEESSFLTNLVMIFNKKKIYRYSPIEKTLNVVATRANRMLMRRYYLVQRIKDAEIIGIVAGTLGVARYQEAINRCKRLIGEAGKKYYLLLVGKINEAKLANFEHIDIFVLVACPQNTVIDSKEFYKPVVTPFELEVALSKDTEWTGEYHVNFESILHTGEEKSEQLDGIMINSDEKGEEGEEDADAPRYSLIDGTLKPSLTTKSPNIITTCNKSEKKQQQNEQEKKILVESDSGKGVIELVREKETRLANFSPAAAYLASRSWKGLEQHLGKTEVSLATEGDEGIPMYYQREINVITQNKSLGNEEKEKEKEKIPEE